YLVCSTGMFVIPGEEHEERLTGTQRCSNRPASPRPSWRSATIRVRAPYQNQTFGNIAAGTTQSIGTETDSLAFPQWIEVEAKRIQKTSTAAERRRRARCRRAGRCRAQSARKLFSAVA